METLGLYSLSGKTSYYKISSSKSRSRDILGLDFFQSLWNLTGTSAAAPPGACQISERYDHCNIQSCGFETLRNFLVRCLTVYWIETLVFFMLLNLYMILVRFLSINWGHVKTVPANKRRHYIWNVFSHWLWQLQHAPNKQIVITPRSHIHHPISYRQTSNNSGILVGS